MGTLELTIVVAAPTIVVSIPVAEIAIAIATIEVAAVSIASEGAGHVVANASQVVVRPVGPNGRVTRIATAIDSPIGATIQPPVCTTIDSDSRVTTSFGIAARTAARVGVNAGPASRVGSAIDSNSFVAPGVGIGASPASGILPTINSDSSVATGIGTGSAVGVIGGNSANSMRGIALAPI